MLKKNAAFLTGAILYLLSILGFLFLKPLNSMPYRNCNFYKKEMQCISQLPKQFSSEGKLSAGWFKCSLVPPITTPIAIDADRGGKHWQQVHDTVYARAFVFSNGKQKTAFVSCELLIVPPVVVQKVNAKLRLHGFSEQNIFYTATHTHSSIGAWHPSPVGEIFAGKYDERVPEFFANQIVIAILNAEKAKAPVKLFYKEIPTANLVCNRLVGKDGRVDSTLRMVFLEHENGESAAIVSFAAHATCLHKGTMEVSGDWPNTLITKMEDHKIVSFACYAAGAVGSHGPVEARKNKWDEVRYMADGVFSGIEKAKPNAVPTSGSLGMLHVPLYLRESSLRVNSHFALRSCWFEKFFGKEKVYINVWNVGGIRFIGMPCDFSGELTANLLSGMSGPCVITSFNGGYIGYVTADERYGLNTYETRTMGWFGPSNGSYLVEVAKKICSTL
ncbi:MAG: neutral/alkaline non-lysosomal ceramidase N-terminal domain-containing protein [Chitinophagales bacterium]